MYPTATGCEVRSSGTHRLKQDDLLTLKESALKNGGRAGCYLKKVVSFKVFQSFIA